MTTFGETAASEGAPSGNAPITRHRGSKETPKRLHGVANTDPLPNLYAIAVRRRLIRGAVEALVRRKVPPKSPVEVPLLAQSFLSFRPYHGQVSFGKDVGPLLKARAAAPRGPRGQVGPLRVVLLSVEIGRASGRER